MIFASPWALLSLVSLPVIVWIHAHLQQRRQRRVAGLFLWGERQRAATSGRQRRRPPITATLLLHLLAAALIALVVARPIITGADQRPAWLVVLDRTISMSAGPDSPRDRAAAWLLDAASEANARVQLIGSGERAVSLGQAESRAGLDELLDAWQPELPHTSLEPALDLALDLAGSDGRVVVLTDSTETSSRSGVGWGAFGRPRDNVGWIAAGRWPDDRAEERDLVRLELRSFSRSPRTVTLRLEAASLQQEKTLELAPDESFTWVVTVPASTERLQASLHGDPVTFDDEVELLRVRRRPVSVITSDRLSARTLAAVEQGLSAIHGWRSARSGEPPELAIVDGFENASHADLHLRLGPLGDRWAEGEARTLAGPFVTRADDPLLRDLDFEGTVWPGVRALGVAATPIVHAGSEVLLSEARASGSLHLLLNGDLGASTFPARVSWPVLLENLIHRIQRERPGIAPRHARLGETITLRAEPGSPVFIRGPEGRSLTLPALTAQLVPELDRPGLYEVEQGGRSLGRFVLHALDARESNLRGRDAGWLEPEDDVRMGSADAGSTWDPSPLLIALALAAWLGSAWTARRGGAA